MDIEKNTQFEEFIAGAVSKLCDQAGIEKVNQIIKLSSEGPLKLIIFFQNNPDLSAKDLAAIINNKTYQFVSADQRPEALDRDPIGDLISSYNNLFSEDQKDSADLETRNNVAQAANSEVQNWLENQPSKDPNNKIHQPLQEAQSKSPDSPSL